MKNYRNARNEWFGFEDYDFDNLGNATNEIVKNMIEKENLIHDEEGYLLYLESIKPSQNEIRKQEIYQELNNIDVQTMRPLRAIQLGVNTIEDTKKLTELEEQAKLLRIELSNL